ncbi:DUF1501 domain-containing protein [bacterium CPR1]|nr:DUF1501 domain-containing protein [bacterium CPR1]
MKRRDFLKATLAMAGVMMLPEIPMAATPRKLVLVHLFGGNDGLNTVVSDSSLYRKLRPRLALKADQVVPLKSGLAFHRALEPLMPIWQTGRLALINGVGYPEPNRSHFHSSDIYHTAVLRGTARYGWLGRFLDSNQAGAVNVGSTLTRALYAKIAQPLCIKTADPFRIQGHQAELSAMYRDFGGHLGSTFAHLEEAMDHCQACPGESVSSGDFGKSLDVILRLLPHGRVFCTALSGFDTHSSQPKRHAEVLSELARGLAGFLAALRRRGQDRDVVVAVYSEFGRRVEENASGGTDHGTAGPLFVLGTGVKGGLYGEVPSLSNLKEGDLVHTVDFRAVYSTLLSRWLQADASAVLGGNFPALAFL